MYGHQFSEVFSIDSQLVLGVTETMEKYFTETA